ncbi:MAG TPA: hypothetical protein DET40_24010 [Lentisphaeria bacterium]|nr:MAG: hypothetical protein A2X45_09060 [Lentisphaerae bacterium GWF2_50_93]HCE46624.1 hypothetical protein [Lentisphaeria bacterium]
MAEEIKIPEVIVDIPEYPNLKRGVAWGLVISVPVFALFTLEQIGSGKGGLENNISVPLIAGMIFSLIAFILVFLLVAFQPIRGRERISYSIFGLNITFCLLGIFICACIIIRSFFASESHNVLLIAVASTPVAVLIILLEWLGVMKRKRYCLYIMARISLLIGILAFLVFLGNNLMTIFNLNGRDGNLDGLISVSCILVMAYAVSTGIYRMKVYEK